MRLHTLRDRHRTLNYWIDLFLRDHGFLRVYWHNQHRVAENVLRSNQPGPFRVAKLAKSGIKTIVNLRGPRDDGGLTGEKPRAVEAADPHFNFNLNFFTRYRYISAQDHSLKNPTKYI